MVHHERARPSEKLVPHVKRRAHRQSPIARRGLYIDLFERRLIENLSIGHTVERHSARQTHGSQACALGQPPQHPEIHLFEPRLQRRSQIAVAILERRFRIARGPQPLRHRLRIHPPERRGLVSFRPTHLRTCAVVNEVMEAETKRGIIRAPVRAHNVSENIELLGLPVGGETHHLVLVAEFQEAEILCQRRVIQPERMRKRHGTLNFHARPCARPPHCAGEITQSVGGEKRRALERRAIKRAGEMRLVVFDAMKSCAQLGRIGPERPRQRLANPSARKLAQHAHALPRERRHPQRVKKLCPQPSIGIARHRDVIDFAECEISRSQAVPNRPSREPRGIFHAVTSLLFQRGHELAIAHNRGRRVSVIRVDPQDVHCRMCSVQQARRPEIAAKSKPCVG